ncbi:MAG TPA: aspartate aminotransferase family protein [Candidatus Margulisiibacteriota bacterium]|nr:aspartate aminotransferase family protein [Candidatus Margulisiibacteriota bacterium]
MKAASKKAPAGAPIPGPKSQALFEAEKAFIAPGLQRIAQLSQLTMVEGRGCTLIDADGNEYLDFFAGVAVASLGHSHPRFVTGLVNQIQRLAVGSFTNEPRLALLKLLAELAPGALKRTQLYSGGAEAVEAAIRLAKSYTKKHEVVGFWGGFHGKTGGVMGLIGDEWKQKWGPLAPGTHLVPYADCYRCPFKLQYPECGMFCLDFIRQSLKTTTAGLIAAIIVEPMQGTAGNVIPPAEFLPGLAEIARENNALLIADEMITGFGRTGAMFGCEHTATQPDVMTIGKGLGSGFPVTGLISTDEITASLPFAKPSSSSSSYGGNPLAATAALTTIETIIDERLVDNAERVGAVLLDELRRLQEKYEFIGDVRGSGLLIGMDLVKDRSTKEPLSSAVSEQIFLGALRRGLLLMGYFPRVRINPPLILTESEARDGVAILDEVFAEVARAGSYRQ